MSTILDILRGSVSPFHLGRQRSVWNLSFIMDYVAFSLSSESYMNLLLQEGHFSLSGVRKHATVCVYTPVCGYLKTLAHLWLPQFLLCKSRHCHLINHNPL